MKKIYLLLLSSLFSSVLFAQVKMTHHEIQMPIAAVPSVSADLLHHKQTINTEVDWEYVRSLQENPITILPYNKDRQNFVKRATRAKLSNPRLKVASSDFYAYYMRPAGTLNAGIDRIGYCFWHLYPAILGAWRQDIEAWVWQNASKGATGYTWGSSMLGSEDYDIGKGYSIDEDNNLVDSLSVAIKGGINVGVSWNVPYLIASNGMESDTFLVNQPFSHNIDTLYDGGLVVAGGPMEIDWLGEDLELWPMTLAKPYLFTEFEVNGTQPEGVESLVSPNRIVATADEAGNLVYVYGTSQRQFYSVDDDSYVNVQPASVTVYYEKPQAPIYVHDITLPITRLSTTRFMGQVSTSWGTPTLRDTIQLTVMDSAGHVVATSSCASAGLTSMSYSSRTLLPGRMLNFKFTETDDFGGVIKDGFTIGGEFSIRIDGLFAEGNDFGMYAAYDPFEGGHAIVTGTDGKEYYDSYDPYLMLNGAFNTFETSVKANIDTSYVSVYMRRMEPEYEEPYYLCVQDTGEEAGYIPALYSTFLPLDTVTGFLKFDVTAPDWARFETNLSYDDYSLYPLYIYDDKGEAMPGDEVIISFYGKVIVFQVVEQPTGVKATAANRTSLSRSGDAFVLSYPSAFKSVQMFNAAGMLMGQYALPSEGKCQIPTAGLPSGLYMFRMYGDSDAELLRAIK